MNFENAGVQRRPSADSAEKFYCAGPGSGHCAASRRRSDRHGWRIAGRACCRGGLPRARHHRRRQQSMAAALDRKALAHRRGRPRPLGSRAAQRSGGGTASSRAAAVRCALLRFPRPGTDRRPAARRARARRDARGSTRRFRPNWLFLPALDDRHPDHSALHVLLQLVLLDVSGPRPNLYTFGVHGEASTAESVVLELSEAQRETKRAAIMSHQTQMRLSRRRFVAYARAQEPYRTASVPGLPDPQHPVQAYVGADGKLRRPYRSFALA